MTISRKCDIRARRMPFKKGNRSSAKSQIRKDAQSAALEAMVWFKRLTGQRVDVETECLALVPTGTGGPPIFRPDGSKYPVDDITPELVRGHVHKHRFRNGVRTNERFYKKGSVQYEHEKRVARALVDWVTELQSARRMGLYEIKECGHGQGLFNLRHGNIGDTLVKTDGTPLRPDFSRTLSATGREVGTQGKYTQSQVDLDGRVGMHTGRKLHTLLCGTVQFINRACPQCATHHSMNWGRGDAGLVQRWYQILPGVEITVDYFYTDTEISYPCQGPFCRPDKWCHVSVGSQYNGVVVRPLRESEDPAYAGAFVPWSRSYTPMRDWLKLNPLK